MLIVANPICIAMGFIFMKLFTKNEGAGIKQMAIFTLIEGVLGCIVTAILGGCRIFRFNALILGGCVGIVLLINSVLQLKAYSIGSLSVFSAFLMLGGMVIPSLCGFVFWKEPVKPLFVIAICLIILFVALMPEAKQYKKRPLYYVICIVVFFLNGLSSVIAKLYSNSSSGNYIFEYLFYQFSAKTIGAIVLFIVAFGKKKEEPRFQLKKKSSIAYAVLYFSIGILTAGFLQMTLLRTYDAMFFYSIQTGVVSILTTMMGFVMFGEKPNLRNIVLTAGILLSLVLMII